MNHEESDRFHWRMRVITGRRHRL